MNINCSLRLNEPLGFYDKLSSKITPTNICIDSCPQRKRLTQTLRHWYLINQFMVTSPTFFCINVPTRNYFIFSVGSRLVLKFNLLYSFHSQDIMLQHAEDGISVNERQFGTNCEKLWLQFDGWSESLQVYTSFQAFPERTFWAHLAQLNLYKRFNK